jgi:hypothetical protein
MAANSGKAGIRHCDSSVCAAQCSDHKYFIAPGLFRALPFRAVLSRMGQKALALCPTEQEYAQRHHWQVCGNRQVPVTQGRHALFSTPPYFRAASRVDHYIPQCHTSVVEAGQWCSWVVGGWKPKRDASDLLAAQGAASWTFHLNRRKVSRRERLGASNLRSQAGGAFFSTHRADVAECSTAPTIRQGLIAS